MKLTKNILLAAMFVLILAGCSKQETADVIYNNGKIYTVNENQPWAEAVAIKDGKFIKVGSNTDVEGLSGKNTKVIDLEGKMILPGLHDVHVHPYESGIAYLKCKLPGTLDAPTWQDFLDAFEEAKPRQSEGWFYGEGYTTSAIPNGMYNKETLDKIFPDQPVLLQDESGHNGWVNSKAIEIVGATKDTELPPGNKFVIDPETGV